MKSLNIELVFVDAAKVNVDTRGRGYGPCGGGGVRMCEERVCVMQVCIMSVCVCVCVCMRIGVGMYVCVRRVHECVM